MKKPMMKKDMSYKKMAYKMKTNQDGGSYSAKNSAAPAKELMKNQMTQKMDPMHKDGSIKGDQSATRVDYSMDKGGTDKGYKGKTGSSKGDQSASKADYAMKKMGRPGIYKHMKS